jgi:hypothetical protein
MDVAAHRDGRIHLQQVRLAPEDLRTGLYYPQRLLFGQAAFAVEMLLQKL